MPANATTSCVGIFWGIPASRGHCRLLADKTPIPQAEPYGEYLTHAAGHYALWEGLKALGAAEWRRRGLPAELGDHEYEEFPRGRVVYKPGAKRFVIYADRRLQNDGFIDRLVSEFGIPPGTYVVRSDSHYREIGWHSSSRITG